jgi:hypothetical protein
MKEEIQKDDKCPIDLTTDAEEEKEQLKTIFGKRLITSSNAANRNTINGMKDALIELYILSRTNKILGSMQSSYSETAAQISGIPYELLTKK